MTTTRKPKAAAIIAPAVDLAAYAADALPPAPAGLGDDALAAAARHPVAHYLASLYAETSRASQLSKLSTVARLLMPAASCSACGWRGDMAASSRRCPACGKAGGVQRVDAWAFPWHALDAAGVPFMLAAAPQIRQRLARAYAPATANAAAFAVRGVVDACWLLRRPGFDADTCARIRRQLKAIPGGNRRTPFRVARRHMADLVQGAGGQPNAAKAARDAALLAVAFLAGLRRVELCALDVADVLDAATLDADLAAAGVSHVLRVNGKGNKRRHIPLPPNASRRLVAWLAARGDAPGAVFLPVNKAGRVVKRRKDGTPARIRSATVADVLAGAVASANAAGGTVPPGIRPHDARRWYVTELNAAGVSLATVATLAGHSNTAITAGYVRHNMADLARAAVVLAAAG